MRIFLIIIAAIVVVAASGYWWFNRQVNYLPEWYTEMGTEPAAEVSVTPPAAPEAPEEISPEVPTKTVEAPELPAARVKAAEKEPAKAPVNKAPLPKSVGQIRSELKRGGEVVLTEAELDGMIQQVLHSYPELQGDYIRGVRSRIVGDELQVESVVALQEIPWEQLPSSLRSMRGFITAFAKNDQSDLFIAVRGKPVIRNNKLYFDDQAKLKIGKISYPLEGIAKNFPLGRQVLDGIPLSGQPVSSIEIRDGKILIRN